MSRDLNGLLDALLSHLVGQGLPDSEVLQAASKALSSAVFVSSAMPAQRCAQLSR